LAIVAMRPPRTFSQWATTYERSIQVDH
jgi:hypothetical protein